MIAGKCEENNEGGAKRTQKMLDQGKERTCGEYHATNRKPGAGLLKNAWRGAKWNTAG